MIADYLGRVARAYLLTDGAQQPFSSLSEVCDVGDRSYVAPRNVAALLAVYRINAAGTLKRRKRWPAELEAP